MPNEIRTWKQRVHALFERFARFSTNAAGSSWAFGLATGTILVWAITGPIFDFSDTWQLVINTGTTIVTFLMVFLIQQSQNKEAMAVQIKLNEIIAALKEASNSIINVEELSEEEIRLLHCKYQALAKIATAADCDAVDRTLEETITEVGR